MKRGKYFLAFWETVLIVASIPVFRSVWMVFDKIEFMNRRAGIGLSLVAGVLLCIVALVALNKPAHEQDVGCRDDGTSS
ncbi:MAG: hypothetical protein L6437_02055 [Kiritimatiellae bacterium]|nr:hypothetical protein [Kiritimatiellia bacterium]